MDKKNPSWTTKKIIEFIKLILRQSNFKWDKYYRGLIGDFKCSCGDVESSIHGLFECQRNANHSKNLKQKLGQRWNDVKIPMDLIYISQSYEDLLIIIDSVLGHLQKIRNIRMEKFWKLFISAFFIKEKDFSHIKISI